GDVADPRHAGLLAGVVLGDEAAQKHGLAALHGHLGFHLALVDGHVARNGITLARLADLLAEFHVDQATGIDARRHRQDHAGVAELHGAGVVGRATDARSGDTTEIRAHDRDLVTDVDARLLVVEHGE